MKAKKTSIVIASILLTIIVCNYASAASWISAPGEGSNVVPSSSGSGGAVCPSGRESIWKTANNDCHGASWIYYKYHPDPNGNNKGDVYFFPSGRYDGDKLNNECKETGGFWHQGYDVSHSSGLKKEHWDAGLGQWAWSGYKGVGAFSGWSSLPFEINGAAHAQSVYTDTIRTNGMAFGYWTLPENQYHSYGVFSVQPMKGASSHPKNTLSHKIYLVNGKTPNTNSYFAADHYATNLSQVKKAYNDTLDRYLKEHPTEAKKFEKWTDEKIPNITAFCAGDGGEASYTGSTTIYKGDSTKGEVLANNSKIKINGPSVKISFLHKITQNKNTGLSVDEENYYVNGSNAEYKHGSSTSLKSLTFKTSDDSNTKNAPKLLTDTVTVEPGKSALVFSTLHFEKDSKTDKIEGISSGACTLYGEKQNGRYCVEVSRPAAKFTGEVSATV